MIAPAASATEEYDIVILGAGPVGSTLALLLAGTRHRVLLLEQRNLDAGQTDPRALALSEGARQLLAPENAWPTPTGQGDGRCTPI
ncbi:MAG: NAD(P)-binding protein, partial [Fluviibacter sp.]